MHLDQTKYRTYQYSDQHQSGVCCCCCCFFPKTCHWAMQRKRSLDLNEQTQIMSCFNMIYQHHLFIFFINKSHNLEFWQHFHKNKRSQKLIRCILTVLYWDCSSSVVLIYRIFLVLLSQIIMQNWLMLLMVLTDSPERTSAFSGAADINQSLDYARWVASLLPNGSGKEIAVTCFGAAIWKCKWTKVYNVYQLDEYTDTRGGG